jgi:hypothetical protein
MAQWIDRHEPNGTASEGAASMPIHEQALHEKQGLDDESIMAVV